MADVKISQLPAATTPVDGTEVLPIVQSATTKQVSIANLTAGRAMSASSLTLTTPLAVTSGGTGLAVTGAGTFIVSGSANTISATATPTLGVQQTTQGTLTLANTAAGAWPVTLQSSNIATAAWTMTLPTAPAAANGYILTSTTTGVTAWTNPTALGVDLDVGTTAITGGTTTRVLYNNAGVLGEYAVTGTGSVVLGTTPTFTTSALFPAGSVSAPSIAASGDTNTGIYFPAADTLAFATNGTEDGRFDSVGNLLLNSATLSPTQTAAGSIAMTGTLAMGSSFKRNRIINGNFAVDQRNAGAAATSNGLVYTLDRWQLQALAATNTAQQVSGLENGKAVLITGNTGNTFTGFGQKIESVNISDLASKTVTVSFTLSGSASGSVSVRFLYPTATDNYAATTEPVAGTTVNFTTTATQYTVSRTLSSNADKGLWLYFDFGAVGSGVTRTLQNVQLEVGSVATPYERQIYSDQLAQCQRYYTRFSSPAGGYALGTSIATIRTATRVDQILSFPVTLRTAPTGIDTTGTASNYNFVTSSSNFICSAVPYNNGSTVDNCEVVYTFSSGLTAGDSGKVLTAAAAAAYLGFSAEL